MTKIDRFHYRMTPIGVSRSKSRSEQLQFDYDSFTRLAILFSESKRHGFFGNDKLVLTFDSFNNIQYD